MSTSALDMRYGRQGGRVQPWRSQSTGVDWRVCRVCGLPILANTAAETHAECAAELEPAQGALF